MTYSSRLIARLDTAQPTSNVGVVGRKVQSPSVGYTPRPFPIGKIEEEAEKKFLGGFSTKSQCQRCGYLLTKSMWCSCVDDGLKPDIKVVDGRVGKVQVRKNDKWLDEE
jgi:hypothetical protein